MSKKDEALKLALEALEHEAEIGNDDAYRRERDAIREALADSALDRMAENERELGIQMQPAQQEPVAWPCVIAEADFERETITLEMQCSDYKVGAGKHWLSTSPPASKPWVWLTDEERNAIGRHHAYVDNIIRATEAKLREKNEHREKNA